MTIEEHNEILKQLKTIDSSVQVIELLQKLQQGFSEDKAELNKAITEREIAIDESVRYAKLNNDLFLKIPTKQEPEKEGEGETQDIPEKLTFENLEKDFI